jgi:hypothetical protein
MASNSTASLNSLAPSSTRKFPIPEAYSLPPSDPNHIPPYFPPSSWLSQLPSLADASGYAAIYPFPHTPASDSTSTSSSSSPPTLPLYPFSGTTNLIQLTGLSNLYATHVAPYSSKTNIVPRRVTSEIYPIPLKYTPWKCGDEGKKWRDKGMMYLVDGVQYEAFNRHYAMPEEVDEMRMTLGEKKFKETSLDIEKLTEAQTHGFLGRQGMIDLWEREKKEEVERASVTQVNNTNDGECKFVRTSLDDNERTNPSNFFQPNPSFPCSHRLWPQLP